MYCEWKLVYNMVSQFSMYVQPTKMHTDNFLHVFQHTYSHTLKTRESRRGLESKLMKEIGESDKTSSNNQLMEINFK